MLNRLFIISIVVCFFVSCGSKKTAVETKTPSNQTEVVNPNTDLALAGAVNFEDEDSLSIYASILKNVIGNKPGAYIGYQMDKLASKFENDLSFTELLRAGEGLILEFNTTSGLFFDSGKTNLNSSSKVVLDEVIMSMKNFPKVNIIIESHTDSSGDEAVNMKMTHERVASIETYLIENGIVESRVKAKAFGESQPRFKNDTEVNRKKNRRVEFGFYASDALKEEAKNMTE
jgi:outer membrane protein OmpA-like peptidoglycan-associated protein